MPAGEDVASAKRAVRARMRAVLRELAADPAARAARAEHLAGEVAAIIAEHPGVADGDRQPTGRPKVMLFESLPTEIELAPLRQRCLAAGSDVFAPAVVDDRIVPVPTVDPGALDVVVVPGLAFGADGRRLGRGGGHYDRFLLELSPSCLRIGVGYAEQRVDDLPVEPRDVALDRIVLV